MAALTIDTEDCTGCGICVDVCPNHVIDIVGSTASVVNGDDCTECGECVEECPLGTCALDD